MKKLALLLTILFLTLTSQTIRELASQEIKAEKIVYNNIQYVAFNLHNAKIMQARFKLYKVAYEPKSNSLISNLFYEAEKLNGDMWELENDVYELKKKRNFWMRLSAVLGFILTGSILLR